MYIVPFIKFLFFDRYCSGIYLFTFDNNSEIRCCFIFFFLGKLRLRGIKVLAKFILLINGKGGIQSQIFLIASQSFTFYIFPFYILGWAILTIIYKSDSFTWFILYTQAHTHTQSCLFGERAGKKKYCISQWY